MNRLSFVSIGVTVLLLLSVVACKQGRSEAANQSSTNVVAKVVFVDQEHCCDCTQNRIDATWDVLSTALEGQDILVERLHRDTQESEVAPYNEMSPIMVVPTAYFLDSEGNLVEVLQGEVTQEQIEALLERQE